MFNNIKWWVLIIIASLLVVYFLPNNISVIINEKLDRVQTEQLAKDFIASLGYSLEDYQATVTRNTANNTLAYLKNQLEEKRFIQLVNSDTIPNIQWRVRYVKNIPQNQPQTLYFVWISPRGEIIGYQRNLPDTLTIPSIAEEEAARKAQLFLTDQVDFSLNNFILRKSQQLRQTNRTDYIFSWEKQADFVEGKFVIRVFIQGDEIGGYDYLFHLPESVTQKISEQTTRGTFILMVQFIALVILFIFILVLFLKKYHEGEVSVSLGRNLFLIVFILGLVRSINEYPVSGFTVSIGIMSAANVQLIMFVYEILLKNVFIGILWLTAWAVGEAYGRSLWPDKMNSIDSVLNKRIFTSNTGIALLRGGAIGFSTTMIYLAVITYFTGQEKDIYQVAYPFGDTFQFFVPIISMVIIAIMMALVSEVIFRFFIINLVYHRWRKKWIAILISAILWPIGYTIFVDYPIFSSLPLNLGLALLMGIVFAWIYFKYDLLTLIAATASANLIFYAVPLTASSADWHKISLYILVIMLLIPAVQIILSFIKKDEFQYSYERLPKHIRRISERERMQKELEIARNVQVGLLPKSNPELKGFDIAGTCLPAKEVGGDYFDFVTLGPKKLGIAIGDVSGKGVPAAIYMTLTKGILQSHADETISPRLVLNKVNKLLYRNIEKNSFVSMFYAVLDIVQKNLTFARAGHNPGIMINQKDGSNQALHTDGIALGMEEGAVFNKTLKEQTIKLREGDTLVFYTDGFTEAMNPNLEEFGEPAFIDLISKNRDKSARELINLLVGSVKTFSKDTPQHDDMTVVIIKIL
jgi:sigma-B regulation protein RsbU (phosphoserine phosphatase)